jgi:hypothetical protein
MVKFNPNDICDYLASRADADFKSVKFKGCLFDATTNELISTFLYEEGIKGKIAGLKPKLEQEFKASVRIPDLKYLFLYKQCYMDAGRLEIKVLEFLRQNFSFLTLDLADDDCTVSGDGSGFSVKLRLTKQTADYIRGSKAFKSFVEDLTENNFATFSFQFIEIPAVNQKELTTEEIEKFVESKLAANRLDKVDKVCKTSERTYLLGAPVKDRPVKIEFLRVAADEQTIAGTISFFTKREFIKKKKIVNENGDEVETTRPMPYWTFVIDDGKKASCVYFPSGRTEEALQKNISKMDEIGDGSTICVVGLNQERNGRVNFTVRGISKCKLG